MNWKDLAHLADLGLCLISLCGPSCAGNDFGHRHKPSAAGKVPRRPDWRASAYRPAAEVARDLRDGDNVGVLCGLVSGATNVVVVDADDDEAVAWAAARLPPTPWRVRTQRGEHWYYRAPAGRPVASCVRRGRLALDVRGQGSQVVAPGSVHHTGHAYAAVDAPWTLGGAAAPPTYDPAWFSDLPEGDDVDVLR